MTTNNHLDDNITLSVRSYAMLARRAANTGDYQAKLEYAMFRKKMEGDTEYARAIEGVAVAREFMDDEVDPAKDATLTVARRKLAEVIDARAPFAHCRYHKYMTDMAVETLPPYNPVKLGDGFTRIELLQPYFIREDAYDIGKLLGMETEEVLSTDPKELYDLLAGLDSPDHPERYVFTQLLVPSPRTMEALKIKDMYDGIRNASEWGIQRAYLNALYGSEEGAGIYRNVIREGRKGLPTYIKNDLSAVLRYDAFTFDCFGEGGDFDTIEGYVGGLVIGYKQNMGE